MAKKRPTKKQLWKSLYLDATNKTTFLNGTRSSIAAGFKCASKNAHAQNGSKLLAEFQPEIEAWLESSGMSDVSLKTRLLKLLDAHETQFFTIKGEVSEDELPDGCHIVLAGTTTIWTKDGCRDEINTLVAVTVARPELQRRSLDMAFKAKGLYAPEKWELTGKDGGPIETNTEVTAKINQLRKARERFNSD
jgi:hypothetical protein